ncbi:MAG: response regulator [Burkholderiales bacterium]|nr:response regulator [Anaerolineae bacterium]
MSKAHALIIDDNAKNVSVLARLLSEEDVSNTQVMHPKQLEAALTVLPDIHLVFLDLEMPGSSGYEVLALLRADSRFDAVPIVAYTVHVSEINVALRHGFDSFLGKPIDPDKFPEQLKRLLNGDAVWETA